MGGAEWEICVFALICLCHMWVSFHLYLFSLRAYVQPFIFCTLVWLCCAVLCDQKKATDSWQALTTFWTGLGSFYFQFKHFWISAWGNKVLIKRHEGGVQTEIKITPTRSEVLTMTFFKSWSMYVVFFLGSWVEWEWQVRFWVFKVLSAFHTWCCQHVFSQYYGLTCKCEWML